MEPTARPQVEPKSGENAGDAAAPDTRSASAGDVGVRRGNVVAAPALRLNALRARGFRNLEDLSFEPGEHFNVIHGDNGAGKSNLLEAIHYLGSLKSFRGAKTDDLIQIGAEQTVLEASLADGPVTEAGGVAPGVPRKLRVQLGRGQRRQLQLDGKRPQSTAKWHQAVPMVLFHPGDLELAGGGPARRREFMDRILEQIDSVYGATLRNYEKALRSRNRLLKDDRVNERSVRAFDEILAAAGSVIGQARARLVEDLQPRTVKAFTSVFGEQIGLQVSYQPRVEPTEDAIRAALEDAFRKDCARGFTADGPHGDDLGLQLDEVAARHHGSQGQQRTIVLSLKVAELDVLSERTGRVPILLLDDVSSELDRVRNRRFFELLAHLGGQVFLTTTHPEFILLDKDRVDFGVTAGRVARG